MHTADNATANVIVLNNPKQKALQQDGVDLAKVNRVCQAWLQGHITVNPARVAQKMLALEAAITSTTSVAAALED